MSLTIGSYVVANTSLEYVAISPVIGGYELVFGMKFEPLASRDRSSRKAELHGAHCVVRPSGGQEQKLGFARFDVPIKILADPTTISSATTVSLRLPISPQQLTAIEELRAGGDLTFELAPAGDGQGQAGQHYIQDTWKRMVPRSEWIQQLRTSGASDMLLLEIPLAWAPSSERARIAGQRLRSAQTHFYHGDYGSCIAACRLVIEELNGAAPTSRPKGVDGQTKGRRDLNKGEREVELVEAARNYANLAHHGTTEGGEENYTRSEARLLLTITAAIAARSLIAE